MEEDEPLTMYGSKTMKLASEIEYQAENLSDNIRMMRIISGLTPLNQNLETLWYSIRAGIDCNVCARKKISRTSKVDWIVTHSFPEKANIVQGFGQFGAKPLFYWDSNVAKFHDGRKRACLRLTLSGWDNCDEMTESEDHTSDERAHYETSYDSDTSIQQIGESISESDMDFQPDFLDKLDNFIQTFKRKTDANVGNIRDDYDLKDNELNSSIIPTITTKRKPLENIVEVEGEEENERKNDSLNKISLVKYSSSLDAGRKITLEDKNLDISKSCVNFTYSTKENKSPPPIKKPVSMVKNEDTIHIIEQEKVLLASMDSSSLPKPLIKLQMLSADNEAKQYQIRQVLIDLDSAHKRIEELQNTIQIKEKFIDDLIKNSNMRATAKERCQRKSSKLEEEYYKTRTNLAQAENALLLNVDDSYPDKEKLKYKQEIEKYKKITVHYEKRLKDIEFIKQIAGDSAKKSDPHELSMAPNIKQGVILSSNLLISISHQPGRSIGHIVLARHQDAIYMRYMLFSAGWQPKTLDFQGSVQAVLELENSLQTSKKQLEELKKQLKDEETHKQTLERELLEDQKKIKELEEKYNLHKTKASKLVKVLKASNPVKSLTVGGDAFYAHDAATVNERE
uniref:Uncharacterized protein n=1 Tax=Timema poppense TaxID=170557 RepID=A0A7R9D8J2_TIMPO|nr:unnamed protein product [Timema poppensis]